ncbi:PREDICTED: remorin-like [Ipomoea nil]|uniref:remorin-like n=1 Tax=Ipomoea nil TaxID=35883 RepID=UPI000900E2FD|nr:PREDICTED: remorin-like [Ipomoea nil]
MAAAAPVVAEKVVAPPPPAAVLAPEEPPLTSVAVAAPQNMGPTKDVSPEKAVVPHKNPDPPLKTAGSKGSLDRDIALAKIEDDKRVSFIKAWEESEKSKVENRAQKKLADVLSWENTKKANIEAKLKKIEEQLEKKKAEYAEKMSNKTALVHKEAEEKRSVIVSQRNEQVLKTEEMAAKFRATGQVPKKAFGCFG